MPEENLPQKPTPPPTPESPIGKPQLKPNESPLKALRTYQGDIEKTLSHTKASLTSIVVAEQKRKDEIREVAKANPESTLPKPIVPEYHEDNSGARNKFFAVLGVLLLVLGVISVGAVYFVKSHDTTTPATKNITLLTYSQEKDIVLASTTRAELLENIVEQNKSFKLPVNSVLYINTTDALGAPADITDVFSLLAPEAPPALGRSLDQKYMLGVYSFDTNEPFLLLTTTDFGSTYAGMLKWEASMTRDLSKLYGINPAQPYSFEDETVKNKDLRIIKDTNGKTILLYVFLDKNTLLITRNENIFTAILGKFTTSKMTR